MKQHAFFEVLDLDSLKVHTSERSSLPGYQVYFNDLQNRINVKTKLWTLNNVQFLRFRFLAKYFLHRPNTNIATWFGCLLYVPTCVTCTYM